MTAEWLHGGTIPHVAGAGFLVVWGRCLPVTGIRLFSVKQESGWFAGKT